MTRALLSLWCRRQTLGFGWSTSLIADVVPSSRAIVFPPSSRLCSPFGQSSGCGIQSFLGSGRCDGLGRVAFWGRQRRSSSRLRGSIRIWDPGSLSLLLRLKVRSGIGSELAMATRWLSSSSASIRVLVGCQSLALMEILRLWLEAGGDSVCRRWIFSLGRIGGGGGFW